MRAATRRHVSRCDPDEHEHGVLQEEEPGDVHVTRTYRAANRDLAAAAEQTNEH